MDLSRFCTDDQTQSPSGLTDGQTRDLDAHSLLHSRTENTLPAYPTGTETVSDFSDPTDKSTEPLANVSKCLLSQETGTNSDCSKPSSFSYNTSECFSFNSEPALKEFRVHGCFGPSKPILPLPHLSHEIISPPPQTYTKHESGLSFSVTQDNITSQPLGDVSSVPGGLLEPPVSELLSSHIISSEHIEDTDLKRLLLSESDSLEHDAAIAPVSDLYIFESETQDFVLSRNVDPWEIKCPECWPLSQTGKKEAHGSSDTHVLMCDSSDMATHCHYNATQERAMVDYESDGIQHIVLKPPAANACEMSINDVGEGKAEVTGLTHQPWRNDSPTELWLDACQYLAGEDNEDKDAMGHSLVQGALSATSDLSFLPGEIQGSGYNPEGSYGIGWFKDDTRSWGPPVERWSSVDSWASALSDWTGIITAPPEDITAAFTEIGAEIDALTQALAKDDTYIETDCLSLCVTAEGPERQDGAVSQSVESVCDSTPTKQGEKESKKIQGSQTEWSPRATDWPSSMSSSSATAASRGGGADVTDVPLIPVSTSYPIGDGLCEVTDEHSISQLGLVVEQEEKVGPVGTDVKGTKSSPDLHLLTTHSLTNSQVRVEDTQPDLDFTVLTRSSPDLYPDIDGTCQVEPRCGSPKFVIPLAPLSISSSLVCQTSSSLEGDQTCAKRSLNDNTELCCDHVQPCVPQPTSDGITDKPSLEGDEELIHKKKNTPDSSPEEQCKHTDATSECFFTGRKTILEDVYELSRELSNLAVVPADHFIISEKNRVACITLDLNDPFVSRAAKPMSIKVQSVKTELNKKIEKMPHKTHKNISESKTRSKKDKSGGHHHHHHHTAQASKKQENVSPPVSAQQQQTCKQQDTLLTGENHTSEYTPAGFESKDDKLVIETSVEADKAHSKPHGKKKKKHGLNATPGKSSPLVEVENGAKPKSAKGRIDMFEAKLGAKAGEAKKSSEQSDVAEKKPQQLEAKASQEEKPPHHTGHKDHQPNDFTNPLKDDVIKRRRLSGQKFTKIVSILESKLTNADVSAKVKGEESKVDTGATHKKSYSEVVKQKTPPKEDIKVVQPVQAVSVSGDPQSLCLWCQFAAVTSDHSVTWSREGTVLAEIKRSAGDESRASFTITNASHKDLGKYQCQLSSLHGSFTLDYLLTYEGIKHDSTPVVVGAEEEDVHCSRLMFKEDFLSDQYFGDNHPASIITEKVHFGEGMHRRAFRTKLQAGEIPLLEPGHPCVLKVHNAISYGTKNNDELIQKNFSLAVEECQVQNTAREYIKSYTAAAQSAEAFGQVPEIIPIYLVHRPSNDIPYATLEEELIGDFVKYSVKDGKEINLMRRDSEAGRKCCTFQHWVYHKTEGNLLVTDMQGVGMRLTDVGIATCKKGYKGFKGNCATSFIDQFKALHQCNTYCEILGLTSLQPKPKKPASAPKAKPQTSAAPKKKTFGPTVKGKS
uniref:non-specific serine/threonine protein kinase n=1 Tax=Mastacembelus armatus TaxID=205130 RepID=A0A7N8Y928_9TELE